MRLIFITILLNCYFLSAQNKELSNDTISKIKLINKIDSTSINASTNVKIDTIVNLDENVSTFKLKSKNDIFKQDSLIAEAKKKKIFRYRKIEMDTVLVRNYKIFDHKGVETFIDSSLTIEKEYKFNYLRKDYFEILPLPNVGQGFNKMGYDFTKEKISPQLGAIGRNSGYIETEDVQYYEVPTPFSELFFKTTYNQGQLIDALISVNTSPNLNLTFAHKGLRSLGNYVNSKTNATNLRFTTQYKNHNERYQLNAHIVSQKLSSEENGGIDSLSVYFFEKAIEDLDYDGYLDRSRLVTNLNAKSSVQGKRYYVNQSYKILPSYIDTTNYNLKIGHKIIYETKNHLFSQNKTNDYLGQSLIFDSNGVEVSSQIQDVHKLRSIEQNFSLAYDTGILGVIDFTLKLNNWDYFKINNQEEEISFEEIQGLKINQQTLVSGWKKSIFGYNLNFEMQKTLKKDFGSSLVNLDLNKKLGDYISLFSGLSYRTESPNFNFFLFRSSYSDYNWYKNDWLMQKTSSFHTKISHSKWGELFFQLQELDDYLFFQDITLNDNINKTFNIMPSQSQSKIRYFKTRFVQNLNFWKFGLINTIQYQDVNFKKSESNFSSLNLPKWITRSTLVLESFVFKNALFLQSGITFQYFSKYYADQYHPVLGEFVSQNHTQIGDFPRIDLFLNAKIQNTRLFLKYEHINSDRTGYNYYSSPFVPYRDGSIRFGLVWNMFQ